MFPLLPLWGLRSILQKKGDEQLQSTLKLRSKYTQISNGLIRTGDIVAKLFQSDVLTTRERDDIQQLLSTPIRANEQLLNKLMLKDDRAYDCFLAALIETDQEHITEILKYEDKYLDTEHSLMIQRNYATLVENLDVDCGLLLDRLYEAGALMDREFATIKAKQTKHEKSETLLALVSKFSAANFEKCVQALEESSQERVVSIMTGKRYLKTDSKAVDEWNKQYKQTEVKETSQKSTELRGDSNHDMSDEQQQNGHHCAKIIKTSSFLKKIKPIKTLGTRFANLPDELQTELSLKVAALHQKTVLPSGANVEICFRKLVRGFIQQKRDVGRKQTEVEDIHEVLRRVNECSQNSAHQFEDKFKTEIQILNEELLLHRTNNHHLNDSLKTTVVELENEKQKSRGLETQLNQFQNELKTTVIELDNETQKSSGLETQLQLNQNESVKQRDELRQEVEEALRLMDESKKKFKALLQDKVIELDTEKQMSEGLETKLHRNHNELMTTVNELDNEKQKSRKLETQLARFQNELMTTVIELDNEKQKNRKLETQLDQFQNELKTTVIELDNEKQKNRGLETQLEQNQNESGNLLKQRDVLRKELDEAPRLMDESKKKFEALLMNKDGTVSELKNKHEQESKMWAEENEYLSMQIQELHKKYSGELRHKLNPVFAMKIRTKAATPICGLTILGKELFVVSDFSSEVEVYDLMKLSLSRRWNMNASIHPKDIVSCKRNKCLYIFGSEEYMNVALRVNANGKVITDWSTGYDWGYGLSVTVESNVILTVYEKNKLNEYSPDGQLIREINLSQTGIRHPWHAIKLTSGDFLVSHSDHEHDVHRVCIVDATGNLKKCFAVNRGSTIVQMNEPVYLAIDANGFVMIADRENRRILLLDSDLKFEREILSTAKHALRRPQRIVLNEANIQLFVADNESNNQQILIFDFKK